MKRLSRCGSSENDKADLSSNAPGETRYVAPLIAPHPLTQTRAERNRELENAVRNDQSVLTCILL